MEKVRAGRLEKSREKSVEIMGVWAIRDSKRKFPWGWGNGQGIQLGVLGLNCCFAKNGKENGSWEAEKLTKNRGKEGSESLIGVGQWMSKSDEKNDVFGKRK